MPADCTLRLVKSHRSSGRRSPGSWAIDGLGYPVFRQNHRVGTPPDPRLPPGARRFWNQVEPAGRRPGDCVGLDSCDPSGLQGQRDGGVVTWVNGKVIAFCHYNLADDAEGLEDTRHLTTRSAGPLAGTWVQQRYRNRGLGVASGPTLRVWTKVLTLVGSRLPAPPDGIEVHVVTTSQGGDRLVVALQAQFPNLDFHRFRASRRGYRFPKARW
jgi:hypothetical protein